MQYERLFLIVVSDYGALMIVMYIVSFVKQDSRLYITQILQQHRCLSLPTHLDYF